MDDKFESVKGQKKSKSRRNKVIIGLLGVTLLCCLCFFAFGLYYNSTPEGQAEATERAQERQIAQAEETSVAISEATEEARPTNTPSPTDIPVPTNTVAPTDTPQPTNTPEPTNTPIPTATPDPNLIRPGTYLIGTDIQPGFYKGKTGFGAFDSCYWARLSDLSGSFDALTANDNSVGQFYIQVYESDFALETDCELVFLESLPEPPSEFPQTIMPGTYLVGRDIQVGLYKGETGVASFDSCYWARLNDLSGEFDGLTANDNSVGQFYVEIYESDFALETDCELVFLESLPEPPSEFPQTIMPGTYLVGRDIQVGRYRGQAGEDALDSCYWARLSNLSGEFSGLTANDNSVGQFYVEVSANDFALETDCELELVED